MRRSCLNHTTAAAPPSLTGVGALEATIRTRHRFRRTRRWWGGAGRSGPNRSASRAMGGAARRRQL
uniref:Uncharacterized protein n=1 Tax=Zea mays TaxID=4577 RepID=B7ZZX0_MAIZE|nr:unknown [Zea mays]